MTVDEILKAYAVLGVRVGATSWEIRRARLRLIREHHPDLWMHNPIRRLAGEEQVKEINRAFSLVVAFLERGIPLHDLPAAPRPRPGGQRRGWQRIWNALPRMQWWRLKRFSFEDPDFFGPGWRHYVRMFSIGALTMFTMFLVIGTLGPYALVVELFVLVAIGLHNLFDAVERASPRGTDADWEGVWDDIDEDSV